MNEAILNTQLKAFDRWKSMLIQTMDDYQAWMEKHRLLTDEAQRRIQECQEALKKDRLTLAFVAEFSRGKTELINAIFFSDYGRRLLPSSAGRTTMCPTELFYDREAAQSYLRLLPIESRLQASSLEQLKKTDDAWIHHPLDLASADQIEKCLQEVIQTRWVTLEEAVHLGLYDPEHNPHLAAPPEQVEIPKWRHARISFPHPLLKQGLTILDTPGLNALGSEPELTLGMLPSAQAVLFVLAADTGVTRSDLEMWQNHINGGKRRRRQGLVVVLNKVDTLWDELQDDPAIDHAIATQCVKTARILGIGQESIFPVSAQKGLLAKVKGDPALLGRSALQSLETHLSQDILNSRKEIIQDTVNAEISHMLENTLGIIAEKQRGIESQLGELGGLSGKSREVIAHLLHQTRSRHLAYLRDVEEFRESRASLLQQAEKMHQIIDLKRLDESISETRWRMEKNWTTGGLKGSMQILFDELRANMQQVVGESEQARKLIRGIYRQFQTRHEFAVIQPKMFSVMRYRVELEVLCKEAEIFRNSPLTAATEKHFLIRQFFLGLVQRARVILTTARREIDSWLKTVLEPLAFQIREHRAQMESRLQDLRNIDRSRESLKQRIHDLQQQQLAVARQRVILVNMYSSLNGHRPAGHKGGVPPSPLPEPQSASM